MSDHEPEQARWAHDVRNASNAIAVSVAAARRLLEAGDAGRAGELLANAEAGSDRLRRLIETMPD